MDVGEIIRKSCGIYRKNFLTLVIPFLVLAIATSLVFGLIESGAVARYHDGETAVITGENLSPPDLLDVDDEAYFEVKAVENDGTYALEIRHDSQPLPRAEIAGRWGTVCLNFKSENAATYHLEIYNFSTDNWDGLQSGQVGQVEVTWENTIKTNPGDYIHRTENYMRVRIHTSDEENVHRLQEDFLIYGIIQPPEFAKIWIGNLAFLLGLTFCFGAAIAATQGEMLERHLGLGFVLRITGRNYPKILTATFMISLPLMGFFYLFLSYSWGIFLILPALLLLFFCAYALHGIMIRSLSPWSSIWNSFKITWENLGATFVLYLLLVLVWFFLGPILILGTFIIWLFLPLWFVALSVTYMDRTGELLENERGAEASI